MTKNEAITHAEAAAIRTGVDQIVYRVPGRGGGYWTHMSFGKARRMSVNRILIKAAELKR